MIASSSGIGLTYHLTRLSIALKKRGYDIMVLSGPKEQVEGLSTELKELGVDHFNSNHIDRMSLFSIYKGKRDVLKIIKKTEDIDIIHANGAIHTLHAYLAIRPLYSNKKPVIVTSVHFIPFQKLKQRVMIAILNRCSNITLPVSDYTKEQLVNIGLNSQKTVTLHNSIDLEVFDKFSKKAVIETDNTGKPSVIYVARLIPIKGHEFFLMAAAKVLKTTDAIFYLVGDGPRTRFLKKLVYDLRIQNNVVFTGHIYLPHVYYFISNMADICVSSSLSENFPYYILECMAARKPIVATNVGGVSEAVIDKINGYLVPPKDPDSLADAILKLIREPDKAREMGLNGRAIVEKYFSMEVMVNKLEWIYESIIKREK
jgi:glycosyltransferase involved in cell wall biosynthesis